MYAKVLKNSFLLSDFAENLTKINVFSCLDLILLKKCQFYVFLHISRRRKLLAIF